MSNQTEFSTENLLTLVDQIKEAITEERISEDAQERIWNALTWDKNDPENKEMMKYLFTGWWIHYNLKLQNDNEPNLLEILNAPLVNNPKEQDVNLVMEQASREYNYKVSREQALNALENTNGDIVDAILELNTTSSN
jgi:hypothetical protein